MSITTKITGTISLGSVLTLGAIFLLCNRIESVSQEYDRILSKQVREQDAARVMQVTFKKQVQAWKNILLHCHHPKEFQRYCDEFFQEESVVRNLAHELQAQATQQEVQSKLDEFIDLHEKAGTAYRQGLEIVTQHGRLDPKAEDALDKFVKGVDRKPTDMIDSIVARLGDEVANRKETQMVAARRDWQILGGASVVVTLFVLVAGVLVARRICRPIHQAMDVLEAVATGDLTRRVAVTSSDEVGRMAASLNSAINKLRQGEEEKERRHQEDRERDERKREREQQQDDELKSKVGSLLESVNAAAVGDLTQEIDIIGTDSIGQMGAGLQALLESLRVSVATIAANAETLTGASEALSAVSGEMSSNAEETAAQASIVSGASEQVNQNVQTVAAGVEEMSASIREIAQSASEAARIAGEAVSVAVEANATISKLGDSSSEIGKVVKVITGIAEQTNLLALNATIEAARAGEAGKGFAVVANEVKELAKETARATEEIGRKIAAIQRDTQGAVGAIKQISDVIGQVNSISNTIAAAVEEQTATTNEMARNVAQAAQGSSEIAENIAMLARSAAGTTSGAGKAQQAAADLARMAAELQKLVDQFRYERTEARHTTSPRARTGKSGDLVGVRAGLPGKASTVSSLRK